METKMKRGSRSAMRGTSKNALRERTRVESLRRAYLELQAAIPSVPPNTKLSKLDILMLATTYISHLTQLLEEDDNARKSHDDNNNDTSCTQEAVGGRAMRDASQATMQEISTQKNQQKGLLHPVKKWPMRARLYADVGAAEAGHLLTEPVRAQSLNHYPFRADRMLPTYQTTSFHPSGHLQPCISPNLHHPTVHLQCKPHPSLVSFSQCGSSYDVAIDRKDEYARPVDARGKSLPLSYFHQGHRNQIECIQRNGGQQYISATNFPGHSNSWPSDMGWDSCLTYNDLNACQVQCHMSQSMNGFSGCWTAWDN